MTIALSNDEIKEITGRKRKDCQAKVLRSLGFEFKQRPDGSILVLRHNVLGGEYTPPEAEWEPNFSAVNG